MEDYQKCIEKLKEKVYNLFCNDTSGHNIDHLERVLNYAIYLQSKEGGDLVVIAVSAFVHDIHRILQTKQGRYVSPKESLPFVEELIKDLNISNEQKTHILFAVEHHEEYKFGKENCAVKDIESKILQDADNLDAIGAMGLVRALKYDFNCKKPIFVPETPLTQTEYAEGSNIDASTIHHIYNKLIRLDKNMNTKSAKALAKRKVNFLKSFIDLYLQEFYGKFD